MYSVCTLWNDHLDCFPSLGRCPGLTRLYCLFCSLCQSNIDWTTPRHSSLVLLSRGPPSVQTDSEPDRDDSRHSRICQRLTNHDHVQIAGDDDMHEHPDKKEKQIEQHKDYFLSASRRTSGVSKRDWTGAATCLIAIDPSPPLRPSSDPDFSFSSPTPRSSSPSFIPESPIPVCPSPSSFLFLSLPVYNHLSPSLSLSPPPAPKACSPAPPISSSPSDLARADFLQVS